MFQTSREEKKFVKVTAILSSLLLLSACGGSVGNSTSADNTGSVDSSFEYGANQETVDSAIADLEPVTLTFQSPANSPNSGLAKPSIAFGEEVEERSGGKITIDIVYGQAIASYGEVIEALADGRVDISFATAAMSPADFPGLDALGAISGSLPGSPAAGELISTATLTELAWGSEQIAQDFATLGVMPLQPVHNAPANYTLCTEPGNTANDWNGRIVRVASSPGADEMQALGASPVSMDYVEVFEALQRNTISCTITNMAIAVEGGMVDVAPNVQYSNDDLGLTRAPGSILAGKNVMELPVAYQQILFDSMYAYDLQAIQETIALNQAGAEVSGENDGVIEAFDTTVLELLRNNNDSTLSEVTDSSILGNDIQQSLTQVSEKWQGKAEELGLVDGGTFAEMNQWYDPSTFDITPYLDTLYEEVVSEYRPA